MTSPDPAGTQTDRTDEQIEAYLKAYRRTQDVDVRAMLQGAPSRQERIDYAHTSFMHFQEGATYCNQVAPYLRQLAGYGDRGYGTYQECPDRETRERFARLVDHYETGYIDGLLDRDPEVADRDG